MAFLCLVGIKLARTLSMMIIIFSVIIKVGQNAQHDDNYF